MTRLWVEDEDKKTLDDLIPMDECSKRLRDCLIHEFKAVPTFRQALDIAPEQWLRAPCFGRKTLKELHFVIKEHTGGGWNYGDLPTRVFGRKTVLNSAHSSWDELGPRA